MTHGTAARPATNTLCEGDGCKYRVASGAGRRIALRGQHLCPVCREEFSVQLGRLPGLYEECGAVWGGGTPQFPSDRTSGGSIPGIPSHDAAADVRTSILATLGSWCRLVAEEQGLSVPRGSVVPLCAFLVRHVDWLVAHPAVAEATADVAVLARRARLIAHEERLRTVRVGPCATQGCQGQLTVDVDAPVILATGIRCDQNAEHVWGRQEWAELSRRLTQVREQRVGRIPDFEQNARDSFRKRTRGTV